jgi:hypothetical protein
MPFEKSHESPLALPVEPIRQPNRRESEQYGTDPVGRVQSKTVHSDGRQEGRARQAYKGPGECLSKRGSVNTFGLAEPGNEIA